MATVVKDAIGFDDVWSRGVTYTRYLTHLDGGVESDLTLWGVLRIEVEGVDGTRGGGVLAGARYDTDRGGPSLGKVTVTILPDGLNLDWDEGSDVGTVKYTVKAARGAVERTLFHCILTVTDTAFL